MLWTPRALLLWLMHFSYCDDSQRQNEEKDTDDVSPFQIARVTCMTSKLMLSKAVKVWATNPSKKFKTGISTGITETYFGCVELEGRELYVIFGWWQEFVAALILNWGLIPWMPSVYGHNWELKRSFMLLFDHLSEAILLISIESGMK